MALSDDSCFSLAHADSSPCGNFCCLGGHRRGAGRVSVVSMTLCLPVPTISLYKLALLLSVGLRSANADGGSPALAPRSLEDAPAHGAQFLTSAGLDVGRGACHSSRSTLSPLSALSSSCTYTLEESGALGETTESRRLCVDAAADAGHGTSGDGKDEAVRARKRCRIR